MALVVEHKYEPRHFFMPYHQRTQRYALLVCHRRAGKTVAVVNDMVARALRTLKEDWLGAYIAPTYGQAKNIAWNYIKKAVRNIPGVVIKESETAVVLPNGAKIRCFGVDNPDALRGLYFDCAVLDEFGEWESRAYTEVIRPALEDRQGHVTFIGTPKGPNNAFAKMRNKAAASSGRWYFLELKASESGVFSPSQLAELREDMDEDEYEQEFECSFTAANKGTYYAKHIAQLERAGKLVSDDLYDPTEKVCIAMDLGTRDACAIWFWQVVAGEVRFIDYWEETGYDADEVCDALELMPYTLETVWLPHDALHETFRSKKSVLDVFRDRGLPARRVPNPDAGNRVIHGINAVRKTLRTYPLKFDATRCSRGLDALRNYSRKYDKDLEVFDAKAKHDHWSHGADAFRYSCLAFNQDDLTRSIERAARKRTEAARGIANTTASVNTNSWTFDDAWREHEQQLAARRSAGRARI